jgi:hypothetical protein
VAKAALFAELGVTVHLCGVTAPMVNRFVSDRSAAKTRRTADESVSPGA